MTPWSRLASSWRVSHRRGRKFTYHTSLICLRHSLFIMLVNLKDRHGLWRRWSCVAADSQRFAIPAGRWQPARKPTTPASTEIPKTRSYLPHRWSGKALELGSDLVEGSPTSFAGMVSIGPDNLYPKKPGSALIFDFEHGRKLQHQHNNWTVCFKMFDILILLRFNMLLYSNMIPYKSAEEMAFIRSTAQRALWTDIEYSTSFVSSLLCSEKHRRNK